MDALMIDLHTNKLAFLLLWREMENPISSITGGK
jgi:hypothetical protein